LTRDHRQRRFSEDRAAADICGIRVDFQLDRRIAKEAGGSTTINTEGCRDV